MNETKKKQQKIEKTPTKMEEALAEIKRRQTYAHDQLTGSHYAPIGQDTRNQFIGQEEAYGKAAVLVEEAMKGGV